MQNLNVNYDLYDVIRFILTTSKFQLNTSTEFNNIS